MFSKFQRLFDLVMEDITSQRKPIQKVDAMKPKEFIAFLKEILPLVEKGKVDLNEVRISEKVDGQSLKMLTQKGKMMFESSYSGVTTWDKVPMTDAAKFIYDKYNQLFDDIYEELGFTDFKLIGELIWIDDLEDGDKVTPVAASYLRDKFGKHGGMVVFDIMKIDDDNLVPFPEEKQDMIFNMIRDLNDDDFTFHLVESIDITKNVTFDLDVPMLKQVITNPEYNKDRYSKTKDAAILEEIEKIKANVCAQLSKIVENTKGAFSAEGDLIEGIVFKVLGSGNQYGMFSNGYRDLKHKYWDSYHELDQLYPQFFREVFGTTPQFRKKTLIPKLAEDREQFRAAYDKLRPGYLESAETLLKKLKEDESIPHAVKRVQLSMGQRTVDRLSVSDYDEFVDSILNEK